MSNGGMKYTYNGIEYEDFMGLDMNMATFRGLDPALGRWCQVDPKAEVLYGMTPYNSMANNPISYTEPDGDIIAQIIGGVIGGVVNTVDQALKGNITSFKEGLAYFGNGVAAGVAVSFGQIGLARGITVAGNKGIQYATGKFKPSDIDSWGDVAGLALDVGTDLMSPGLTNAISKPLTKSLTAKAATSMIDGALVSGGRNLVKVGGAVDDIAFSMGFTDEFVVTASRIGTNLSGQGFKSFYAFKQAFGSAGKGNAWHHIVEQHADNIARFGAENLHNVNNLVKLPHGKGLLHQKVTGHYNSLMRGTNIRVRDYVKTLSFKEQYNYGIETLKRFGWTP